MSYDAIWRVDASFEYMHPYLSLRGTRSDVAISKEYPPRLPRRHSPPRNECSFRSLQVCSANWTAAGVNGFVETIRTAPKPPCGALRCAHPLLSLRGTKCRGNLTQHLVYSTHPKPPRTGINGNLSTPFYVIARSDSDVAISR